MPESRAVIRVIDVYPYRFTANGNAEFLLLHRAVGRVYEGRWRMVGGKIAPGEAAWQAALRELREETGHTPRRFWMLPSVNVFYEWEADRVNLAPAFAAEIASDPAMDAEHDGFAWVTAENAARRLAWPEQQRLVRLADRLLTEGVMPELIIPLTGRTE